MSPSDNSSIERKTFQDLAGWENDNHLSAFSCFLQSARRIAQKRYTTKPLGADAQALAKTANVALAQEIISQEDAKHFFQSQFEPVRFSNPEAKGLLTGYFEPEIAASRVRTKEFNTPIYRRPDDLIDIDDTNRPTSMDSSFFFARNTSAGPVHYHDRAAINSGVLDGRNLELFWVRDPVDAFFVHIQGSARLKLTDGTLARISYAAKSGHPYTPIGKVLIDRGALRREDVSMQTIRSWMTVNSDQRFELMEHNRSYIFFQELNNIDPDDGPVAAASVPLTPGRSLAIDHRLFTFGTPFWVSSKEALPDDNVPLQRLLIAQDTGSAIVGAQRGDLFIGSGDSAGDIAGRLKLECEFIMLIPRT